MTARTKTQLVLPIRLNVVCCHAGMVEAFPVTGYPLARFDALMQVNLRAPFIVAQAASQRWTAQGIRGHLIFTTSVAHAFLYLCSPMADYMTGAVLLVDGGCSLYPMD